MKYNFYNNDLISKHLAEIMKPITEFNNIFASQWADTIKKANQSILDSFTNSKEFKELQKTLSDLAKKLKVPSLPEEKKKGFITAYAAWGDIGWADLPFTKHSLSTPPGDLKTANRRMMRLCNNENMQSVYVELFEMGVKKSDLNEAIDCFDKKHYKACAMILFALIESRLIREQEIDPDGKKWREVSHKAVTKVMKMTEEQISEDMFFRILRQTNLASALARIFESGNDFRKQPEIINRNFLLHGMLHRRVLKRDCIQLFLILHSITIHLDILRNIK